MTSVGSEVDGLPNFVGIDGCDKIVFFCETFLFA
jgi:hypothetical protein